MDWFRRLTLETSSTNYTRSRIKIRNKDFTFWLSNGLLANVTDLGLGSGVS